MSRSRRGGLSWTGEPQLGAFRRGDADDESGAGLALLHDDRAAVSPDDLPDDGEAEADAALSAAAGVVEAREAVEDPLSVGGRDPAPVVLDRQDRFPQLGANLERDPGAGVALGVPQEIADHLAQLVGVSRE